MSLVDDTRADVTFARTTATVTVAETRADVTRTETVVVLLQDQSGPTTPDT